MRHRPLRADALSGAPLLDAFCDALWLEDGLSKNTIASYRSDLEQWFGFVRDPLAAGEEDLFRFLATRKGRASSAARRVSTLKRFYLEKNRIRLEPANAAMKPIYVKQAKVLGVVVGVVRKVD